MAQKIKDSSELNPNSSKFRLPMSKRSSAKPKTPSNDPFRFQGNGVDCKGKFIGERDVSGARGDEMCAEAIKLAKIAVKSSGSHKQRIILNISTEGLKIKEEKSGAILFNFPVSKISFIARDTTDARAFGFVFGTQGGKYKFYGIKTAQTADTAVLMIRDMFQVVFEMKKNQVKEAKQKKEEQENAENSKREEKNFRVEDGVAVADLLDLETELENIQQVDNQLQHIQLMPQDVNWPTNGTAHSEPDPFSDAFFAPTTQAPPQQPSLQNGFWSQPSTIIHSSTNPFVQSMLENGTAPTQLYNSQNAFLPAPPQRNHLPPVIETNGHSATSSVNGQSSPEIQEIQWSSSSASSLKENAPMPTANGFGAFGADFTTNLTNGTAMENQPKVSTLEEAFNKLVDVDKLFASSGPIIESSKKNPFESLINPPQVPLNAIPTQQRVQHPTAVNEPFSDPFFN
ncbi:Protein disabled [Aphelenchoides bicaudatus]|nr:Protein disabled [Aphelenchoides bicaudatus]